MWRPTSRIRGEKSFCRKYFQGFFLGFPFYFFPLLFSHFIFPGFLFFPSISWVSPFFLMRGDGILTSLGISSLLLLDFVTCYPFISIKTISPTKQGYPVGVWDTSSSSPDLHVLFSPFPFLSLLSCSQVSARKVTERYHMPFCRVAERMDATPFISWSTEAKLTVDGIPFFWCLWFSLLELKFFSGVHRWS